MLINQDSNSRQIYFGTNASTFLKKNCERHISELATIPADIRTGNPYINHVIEYQLENISPKIDKTLDTFENKIEGEINQDEASAISKILDPLGQISHLITKKKVSGTIPDSDPLVVVNNNFVNPLIDKINSIIKEHGGSALYKKFMRIPN